MHQEITPPLGIGQAVIDYLNSLLPGELVVECGQSCMLGCVGTVVSGKHGTAVQWDPQEGETGLMTTSVTWGTRRLNDAGEYGLPAEVKPVKWQPIDTAPRDGTWILLAAPSGYRKPTYRVEVCRYDDEYRPLQPWINHARDSFLDGGEAPTKWAPLPND